MAAASIGLSAYAAHGVADPIDQSHLQMASLFAFGHGIALAALGPGTTRRLGSTALYVLLLGTLLFAGSLGLSTQGMVSTSLAPVGGIALMLGWVTWAVDAIRR